MKKEKLITLMFNMEQVLDVHLETLCKNLSHKEYCKVLNRLRELVDEYCDGNGV